MPASGQFAEAQIVINVVDGATGEVVQKIVKSFDTLAASGSASGKKVAAGMTEAGVAAAKTAQQIERGSASASANLRRTAADSTEMAGRIRAANASIAQSMTTAGNGFGGSSFSAGAVSNLKQVTQASRSSIASLDQVRLAAAELGLRIPRALETIMTKSQGAMQALSAISGVLITIGAIRIAWDFGKSIYDFYDKLQDVNVEMRKYSQQAAQNATQKIVDTQSIEEANALLQQTNGLVAGLDTKRAKAGVGVDNKGSTLQYLPFLASAAPEMGQAFNRPEPVTFTDDDDKQKAQLKAQADLLQERKESIQEKRAVDQQEAKATTDGMRLTGYAAVAAAQQNAAILATLKQQQAQKDAIYQHDAVLAANNLIRQQNPNLPDSQLRDKGLQAVPVVAQNLGAQDRSDAVSRANAESSAKHVAMARKEADDIAQLRAQAQEAGLQGESLYRAQLQATIDGYNRRVADSELSTAAAHQMAILSKEKYDAEYQQRLRNEQSETQRIQDEAGSAGLTGLARNDAELRTRMDEIAKQAPTFSDPSTRGQRESAARTASGADQSKEIGDLTERFAQMDASRAEGNMTANQRIAADTARTVAEIRKAWTDLYGLLAANDPRRVQGQQALDSELKNVYAAQADQQKKVRQDLGDQTRQLQGEASRGGGGDNYAERYRAVESELQEHLQKVAEMEDAARKSNNAADLANLDLLEQQKLAYRQIANNKELDLARQQRDKLAGELRGYFSNPLDALKRSGEDIASKAGADLLMGNLPGRGPKSAQPGQGGGGIFDLFRPTFKRNGGVAGSAQPEIGHTSSATTQAVVNATTAVINVGNATFASGQSGSGSFAATGNGTFFNVGGSSSPSSVSPGSYVSTGNGGLFNLGSTAEMGSAASSGVPFSDPIASSAQSSFPSGMFNASPSIPVMPQANESPAQAAQRVYGTGTSIAKQANSIGKDLGAFGKDANGKNAGLISKIPGLKNLDSDQLGKLGGFAGGALGVFSAFEGKGGIGGAAQGALSGAQAGMEYGGVAGAAVGAVIGGIAGLFGHGARDQAQKYWFKELQPKLQAEMLAFGAGTADYQSVYDDLNSSDLDAKQKTKQMGAGAVDYYNDRIHPQIQKDMQQVTREQKSGRSQFGMSAAQFHQGGLIDSFGSMATGTDSGWIHAQRGEVVLNEQAAMSHGDVAMMMNSGASRSQIGDYLGGGGGTRAVASSGGDTHLHVHTLDTKSATQWLYDNRHTLRGAINQSYAENSGGSDL